jgi:hypothetical protein
MKLSRRDALRLAAVGAASAASFKSALGESGSKSEARKTDAGVFVELPFGAVKPAGWLRVQLQKQADGITGHLNHLYAPFTGTAWAKDETKVDADWVPWEVRGYWCDGALRCGLLLGRDELVEQAGELVRFTFAHPQGDGYLGPGFLKAPGDYHRWPHNVFFRAAMAWHGAGLDGGANVVEGLRRHYLDSPFTFEGERNQMNIEAMLWTYDRTGDKRLVELAERTWELSQKQFAAEDSMRALTEAAMLSGGPVINMHGVTYAEHSKLPALLYKATGKQRYLELAVAGQRKVLEHHLLASGGASSTEYLSTTAGRDASEVCDLADYPWSWGYLMMATGDGLYGDHIERTTFNAVPGALRKDWKALQYYTSPNQFLATAHSDHLGVLKGTSYPDIAEYRYMQRMSYRPSPGYSVVCCPANLNRILPNYIARMWMRDAAGEGLAATLYGPCVVRCKVGREQAEVEIEEETRYPYGEEIVFRVKTARAVEFPLHLRIPAWCVEAQAAVNGKAVALGNAKAGFVVTLRLPMAVTTSDWPEDGIVVERGPLVYAYPIQERWAVVEDAQSTKDFPAWDLTPEGEWNYALLAHAALPNDPMRGKNRGPAPVFSEAAVEEKAEWDPWVEPPSSIAVAARKVTGWELTKSVVNGEDCTFTPRLPDAVELAAKLEGPVVSLKLVPYASTELRVTVFPHVKADLGVMPGGKVVADGGS